MCTAWDGSTRIATVSQLSEVSPRRARNTERAYSADLADFREWCRLHHRRALPATASTVATYLDDLARFRRPATVRRRLAAIVDAHVHVGFASPRRHSAVRLAAARADWQGRARRQPAAALIAADLAVLSRALPRTPRGRRDRALILIAYGAGLRRSEVVALDRRDVRDHRDHLRIRTARGTLVIPVGSTHITCAVRAWRAWRSDLRIAGPAFRSIDRHGNVSVRRLSDRAVTEIVRAAAANAGLDPGRYTGRSLRLGFIDAAARAGASDDLIMSRTGHRSARLVREYRRR
jgi:site-specific recombinase XerD